jgi:hypothetical protein
MVNKIYLISKEKIEELDLNHADEINNRVELIKLGFENNNSNYPIKICSDASKFDPKQV